MKKIISLLTLSILVSSCGNHLSIVKRHYTKGFYVENGKKSTNVTLAGSEIGKMKNSQPTVVGFLADEKPQKMELVSNVQTKTSAKQQKENGFQSQLKKHTPSVSQNIMTPKKVSEKEPVLFSKKEIKQNSKNSGGDIDLIILIILCFFPFINLISMYLKDGKNITLNFWVDLILDCLFFLPGIIFALLVVLDVVNLA